MKRVVIMLVAISLLINTLVLPAAAYTNVTIRFSNVGNTSTAVPALENDISYTGLIVNNYPMVKVTDICSG